MLNIYYLTRINFDSNKANVYNTVRTCEALSSIKDARVILVSIDDSLRSENRGKEFFIKHGVKYPFDIISLSSVSNKLKFSKFRFVNWIEVVMTNISLAIFLISERKKVDVIYFRDPLVVLPILIGKLVLRKPVFFEIHAVLHRWHGQILNNLCSKIADGIIVISHGLGDYYRKYNKNIIVSFCAAAEPERFSSVTLGIEDLRKKLNLPLDKKLLGYAGNLFVTGNNDPYGIEDIIRSLPLLDKNIFFVGVGKKGNETENLEILSKKLGVSSRIMLLPWVAKSEIAEYLLAFDVLLIPAAGAQIGNSPTKMFEYLVSGKPVVAANTQAIAEVLISGRNAVLVDYKDPVSWKNAIVKVLSDRNFTDNLIRNAKEDSLQYSWEKRGQDIYSFIKSNI